MEEVAYVDRGRVFADTVIVVLIGRTPPDKMAVPILSTKLSHGCHMGRWLLKAGRLDGWGAGVFYGRRGVSAPKFY